MAAADIILLDADIVAYALASRAQKTIQWPGAEEPTVWLDDWAEMPERIDAVISELTRKLKTTNLVVCLSCPTAENWRLDHLPSYKGNRKAVVKPEYLARVKDYLEQAYPSYRRDRLEADDIMGILSTMPGLPKVLVDAGMPKAGRKIIVSEDKDMKTIPGWLFNPAKDKAPRLISDAEADWWHLYQTLVGDATDGYAGCPGIGPKKAALALTPWEAGVHDEASWKCAVVPLFSAALGRGAGRPVSQHEAEQDALTQARVARICRASDYDFNRKEGIPWTPDSLRPLKP